MPPSCAVLSQLPSGIVWLRAPVAPPKSGDIVTVAALEQVLTRGDGDDMVMMIDYVRIIS
jgi:hypothetical protein